MGARQPRRSVTLPFSLSDYKEIPINRNRNEHGQHNYRLLQNINTGFEMQEYRLYFHSQAEYRQYYDAFEWRLTQQFIVATVYFVDDVKRQFCSTVWGAIVYTEHIPLKLSSIKDIPFPDNLYILSAALDGFSVVFSKIGYFTVQENMICINKQGRAKVWVNDDLSRLEPEESNLMRQGREGDMVHRIIQLLDFNSDPQSLPMSIRDYMKKYSSVINFAEAKNLVRQMCKEYKVEMPESFQCINEILSEENDTISIVPLKKQEYSERISVSNHQTRRGLNRQPAYQDKFQDHSTIKESRMQEEEFFPTLSFRPTPVQLFDRRFIPQHFQKQLSPHIIVRSPQAGSPRYVGNISHQIQSLPTLRKNRVTPIVYVRSNPPQRQIAHEKALQRSPQPRMMNIRYPQEINNVSSQPQINIYRSAQQPKSSNDQVQRQKRDTYYSTKRTKKYKEDNNSDIGPGYISDTSNNNKPYRQRHSQSELDNPRFNPVNVEKVEKGDDKNFKKKIKIKSKDSISDIEQKKPTNRILDFSQKTSMLHAQESLMESSKRIKSGIRSPTSEISQSRFKSKIRQPTTELTENIDIVPLKRDKTAFELAEIRQKMTQTLAATRQAIKNTQNMGSPRTLGSQRDGMESEARKYYSSKYGHELDPEIAMDLLGMGL